MPMTDPSAAGTATIVAENLMDWQGQDVVDAHSEKLGKLESVFYDGEVDQPAFAGVKSGLFGKKITLVPLDGASVARNWLRVRVSKEQVKAAPSFDPDSELTLTDEERAYQAFGLEYRPLAGSSRRLAKR